MPLATHEGLQGQFTQPHLDARGRNEEEEARATSEAQEQTTRAAKHPLNLCPQGRMSPIPLRVGECVVWGGWWGTEMTWLRLAFVTPTSP